MAIGGAIALVLTTLAVTTRLGAEFLETVTAMFNPLPAIALMPLALFWFGLGVKSLIFVIVHSVLWPMPLNTYTGLVTVPPTLRRVGENFGLSGWRLVAGILLPAAFPYVLSGIKIGWAFAWRTIIAAEMVFGVAGSQGGLGWFIYQNRFEMNTDLVFAGLLTATLIGLLVENLFFRWIERKTVLCWGMAVTALLLLAAIPGPAGAQPAGKVPRIGMLREGLPGDRGSLRAFRQGLQELGYVEGQNLVIEYRFDGGRRERLPALAADLVRLSVDVIVTSGPDAIRAAQQATRTIPIVVGVMHEPMQFGFVASLARPGGNITGLAFQDSELVTKRLELLREVVPGVTRMALLIDPVGGGPSARRAAEEAARSLGLQLQVLEVREVGDIERAFSEAKKGRAQALVQSGSPLLSAHTSRITRLAERYALPATCEARNFVVSGCLMS